MKFYLTAVLVFASLLASPVYAGESKAQKNWGTQTGDSGSAPIARHYELGVIAGQVQDGNGLTGGLTSNTYYNQSCGNCTSTTIQGNGNSVSTDSKNTGNVGAQQGVGNGGIQQGINQ